MSQRADSTLRVAIGCEHEDDEHASALQDVVGRWCSEQAGIHGVSVSATPWYPQRKLLFDRSWTDYLHSTTGFDLLLGVLDEHASERLCDALAQEIEAGRCVRIYLERCAWPHVQTRLCVPPERLAPIVTSFASLDELRRKAASDVALQAYAVEYAADDAARDPATDLSIDARLLLDGGARDRNGLLLCVRCPPGQTVRTAGKAYASYDPERWSRALTELSRAGLIADADAAQELFHLTARGYRAADALRQGGVFS